MSFEIGESRKDLRIINAEEGPKDWIRNKDRTRAARKSSLKELGWLGCQDLPLI
jgi:hypothetical protein